MPSFHQLIADTSHHWELLEDMTGRMEYCSPSCLALTGFSPGHFLGRTDALPGLAHSASRGELDEFLAGLRNGPPNMSKSLELRIVTEDGLSRWVVCHARRVTASDGRMYLRASLRDISRRKALDMELKSSRLRDPVTGLYNRAWCMENLQRNLGAHSPEAPFSVTIMDIDRLKKVNDTLGPAYGDEIIRMAAERIAATMAPPDSASRISGDGFALLFPGKPPREVIKHIKRIQALMSAPFDLRGHEVTITASAGIVVSPMPGDKPEDVLRNANIALRRAKANTHHRYKVFHSRMFLESSRQMEIEIDLDAGLRNAEFFLEYQPIVCLETKRLKSVEALLRWNHPRHGIMPPDDFLPVAEATDFIVPLGEWVLRRACTDMVTLMAEHPELADLSMSVNISARQLAQHNIAETVAAVLRETGMDPTRLKLELTETMAMENPALTTQRLHAIKALGVKISIDDFGTGYSSLSSLQNFPIDTIKVDKSFVGKMDSSAEQRKIVRSVISLAHSLDLDVVAEGIEMREQWSMLKVLDCQSGQGFLFSHPVDMTKLRAFICKSCQPVKP